MAFALGAKLLPLPQARRHTNCLLDIADKTCAGKVVMVLEGGYDLGAMRKSTKAVLETMSTGIPDKTKAAIESGMKEAAPVSSVIEEVKKTHKPYWECFKDV